MKRPFFSSLIIFSLFFFSSSLFAGNLSLIEKRLIELDKLNKQAVKQAGELPQNGSVEIEAKVYPNSGSRTKSMPGVTETRFVFGKKRILSLDQKYTYTVQISSSRSQQQCYRVATMLRRAGYPAFTASIELNDTGIWHRMFVGSYATQDEAEDTRLSLEKDEISDGFIRSLPYAVQVGKAGTFESLSELKESLFAIHYLPYTSDIKDTKTDASQTRLLVGAFETREDTATLVTDLRSNGIEARVVNR